MVIRTLALLPLLAAVLQDAPSPPPPPPPSTDVWLIAGPASDPVNLTDRDGYDNQPTFSADGRGLFYTSSRDGQTDIYLYDLSEGSSRRLTSTAESEYSPTPMAGGGFSVVRVEADGKQRLWAFDSEGKSPKLLLEKIEPVGYHAWIDDDRLALFVLGEPPTLRIAHLEDGSAETVAENIGRSLHRTEEGALAYVDKTAEPWVIRRRTVGSDPSVVKIAETRAGREDFALTPSGEVLMAEGAVIYRWSQEDEAWSTLFDLSSRGVANISRIALASDGSAIAFVADR